MKFAEEPITLELLEEVKPLLEKHWEEVSSYPDIPLDPDYEVYLQIQRTGHIRAFSARDGNGVLVGYSVFFIRNNSHYRKTIYALNDIIFIKKECRGHGGFFISWCEDELRKSGVIVCQYHIKVKYDWSAGLLRSGYNFEDKILAKRLDK